MLAPLLAALGLASAPTPPPEPLRMMVRTAQTIVAGEGERLWPGFARAPFHIAIVGPEVEWLMCRDPETGFTTMKRDKLTGCSVQWRPRQLPTDIAASFDFLPGTPTIAIGYPQIIGTSRADWTLILVHEDFHQYQWTIPGYNDAVKALGLATGPDGAWMLGYPFPYANPRTGAAYGAMDAAALAFLSATTTQARHRAIGAYVTARSRAAATMPARDWRYHEFQVGQEGVARWTEIALAAHAGLRDPGMAHAARERRASLSVSLKAMREQGLKIWQRSVFYVLGAIEAEMLQAISPGWRADYLRAPFAMGAQLERACVRVRCAGRSG